MGVCKRCGAGTAPNARRVVCATCPPGRASGDGFDCNACAVSGYTPNRVSRGEYCSKCDAGRYASRVLYSGNTSVTYSAAVACLRCPAGKVSAAGSAGRSACRPCKGGQQPSKLGSYCEECSADTYSPRGVECSACKDQTRERGETATSRSQQL